MADRFCSISGCDGKFIAKGLCHKHYMQVRRKSQKDGTFKPKERAKCHVCGLPATGLKLCNRHYIQFKKGLLGNVVEHRERTSPVTFDWLEENSERIPEAGCMIWLRSVDEKGYGLVRNQKKLYRAHRLSYELVNGPIPDGMFICHRCDTPSCINPDHLFAGTALENAQDRDRKGRDVFSKRRNNT